MSWPAQLLLFRGSEWLQLGRAERGISCLSGRTDTHVPGGGRVHASLADTLLLARRMADGGRRAGWECEVALSEDRRNPPLDERHIPPETPPEVMQGRMRKPPGDV